MKLSDILAAEEHIEALNQTPDVEITGVYISDMVSDIMSGAKPGNILLTLQTHSSVVAAANLADSPAIVFVRGRRPAPDLVQMATRASIGILATELDSWTFATKIFAAGIA